MRPDLIVSQEGEEEMALARDSRVVTIPFSPLELRMQTEKPYVFEKLQILKEMIGDETFTVGQQIKLYLDDVSTEKKGSIQVTRAAPGFLKRLFEEEIHEVVLDKPFVYMIVEKKTGMPLFIGIMDDPTIQ